MNQFRFHVDWVSDFIQFSYWRMCGEDIYDIMSVSTNTWYIEIKYLLINLPTISKDTM